MCYNYRYSSVWARRTLVGLAQMVRASDCGPEGRRFDPDIPPHEMVPAWCIELGTEASQGANGSIPISHPIYG